MKRFMNDERGVTLIEMMTALLIISMVTSILYAYMLMGITMYKKVSTETQLRNQANLVFSQLINNLRDAVYVKEQDADPKKITVVKWGTNNYIKPCNISFEPIDPAKPDGPQYIRIEEADRGADAGPSEIRLGVARFTMVGSFHRLSQNQLEVTIDFKGEPKEKSSAMEDAAITLKQQIPLFRIE